MISPSIQDRIWRTNQSSVQTSKFGASCKLHHFGNDFGNGSRDIPTHTSFKLSSFEELHDFSKCMSNEIDTRTKYKRFNTIYICTCYIMSFIVRLTYIFWNTWLFFPSFLLFSLQYDIHLRLYFLTNLLALEFVMN